MVRDEWTRVDERVLRWVLELPPTWQRHEILTLPTSSPEPFEPIEGLDTAEVARSLKRLHGHGLIAGREDATMGADEWWDLRVAANGLMVLGEWPDFDRVASAAFVHGVLTRLAEGAPPEDREALVGSGGLASRTADDVVRGIVSDIVGTGVREGLE